MAEGGIRVFFDINLLVCIPGEIEIAIGSKSIGSTTFDPDSDFDFDEA